jgi:hypothetical protein
VHETLTILGRIYFIELRESLVVLVHIIFMHVDVGIDMQDYP